MDAVARDGDMMLRVRGQRHVGLDERAAVADVAERHGDDGLHRAPELPYDFEARTHAPVRHSAPHVAYLPCSTASRFCIAFDSSVDAVRHSSENTAGPSRGNGTPSVRVRSATLRRNRGSTELM